MNGATSRDSVGILRLAGLLTRYRFRSSLNLLRARPAGPFTALLVFGLFSAVAYVGLFATTLSTLGAHAGAPAQIGALQLMAGAIALASLGAKASGEGLFAGTPENEFLLTRPVSLPRLVVARCLAALVGDPFGTLFLFPILIAAALAWDLPPVAWLVAAATSVCAQFTLTAVSQIIQVAVVRWIPRRRRTGVLVLLRLFAALTMASAWVAATWVLRTPRDLASHLAGLQAALAWSPVGLLVAPVVSLREAGIAAAGLALLPLLALALGAGGLVGWVARRAGARGWEEAGAPFAEASARAPGGPPLTLVRREWRLLARDRPRLAALVALPLLLFGVQLLGSVGWSLATATLPRVAMLTFSIIVYLGTLGPLPHMQHERRAFWILRSLPVPVGAILVAKVKAWAAVLGGGAVAMFLPLALSVPGASAIALLSTFALVLVAALLVTVLAVSLACVVADLSDDHRAALGPGTAYLFLLLGGLLNVVFQSDGGTAFRVLLLYTLAAAALWRSGLQQLRDCLDPEPRAGRMPRLSHAAILLLLFAVVPLGIMRGAAGAQVSPAGAATARLAVILLLGIAAGGLLLRRVKPSEQHRQSPAKAMVVGLVAGGAVRLLGTAAFGGNIFASGTPPSLSALVLVSALAVAEELIFRGVAQGGLEQDPASPLFRLGSRGRRWAAAAVGMGLAWLASFQAWGASGVDPSPLSSTWIILVLAVAPALARATTGRVLAACAARLVMVLTF